MVDLPTRLHTMWILCIQSIVYDWRTRWLLVLCAWIKRVKFNCEWNQNIEHSIDYGKYARIAYNIVCSNIQVMFILHHYIIISWHLIEANLFASYAIVFHFWICKNYHAKKKYCIVLILKLSRLIELNLHICQWQWTDFLFIDINHLPLLILNFSCAAFPFSWCSQSSPWLNYNFDFIGRKWKSF